MVNYDVVGRLKTLDLDIEKSPAYNDTATRKARALIDEVLRVFQTRLGIITGGGVRTPNSVVDKFVGNNGYIKDRISIIRDINVVQQRIELSNAPQDVKKFVNNRLEMIKRA